MKNPAPTIRLITFVLFSSAILMTACHKKTAINGTGVYGRVTHAGKESAEPGIQVFAVLYYNGGFSITNQPATTIIDSAVTDADGHYTMELPANTAGDSVLVYCMREFVTTAKRIVPGQVNNNIDLSVLANPPVIVHKLHVINNKYPPLVVFYIYHYDSVTVSRTMDTTIVYTDNRPYAYHPYVTDQLTAGLDCYYYKGGERQSLAFIYFNLKFADTMTLNTTIDASIFRAQ